MSDELPIDQVLAVIDRMARKVLKRRRGNEVILPNAQEGWIWVPSRKEGVYECGTVAFEESVEESRSISTG